MAPKNENKEKSVPPARTGDKRAGRAQKKVRVELTDPRELPMTPDVLNSNRVHGGAMKAGARRK